MASLIDDVCILVEKNPVPWIGISLDRQEILKECKKKYINEILRVIYDKMAISHQASIWLCSFVTPTKESRELVSTINNDAKLSLIYIKTSVEECIRRDIKGHYHEARMSAISDFTGISSPFEESDEINCETIETDDMTVAEAVGRCLLIIEKQMVMQAVRQYFLMNSHIS